MSILKIYRGTSLQILLQEVVSPVEVIYLAVEQPEPDTLTVLSDLMALTPHLIVTTSQASPDRDADQVIVRSKNGRDLIFVGAPLGLELAALVSAIVVAGRGDSGLSPTTRQMLADLPVPVHLEIFTTPT